MCIDNFQSGIQKQKLIIDDSTILNFFESFVTPNLLGKIASETNRYSHQFNIQTPFSR